MLAPPRHRPEITESPDAHPFRPAARNSAGRAPAGCWTIPLVNRPSPDPTSLSSAPPVPRVVIVGCGFGGLFCARALNKAPIELVVVDRNNYHLFQPLLYQVASAALAPADIAQPIRTILRGQKNAFVMLGEVERVALEQKCIFVKGTAVPYDYLVLAPGAVDNYFGHADWS